MGTLKVADLMTRELTTVGENDDLDIADQLMSLGRFRHLPVISEGRLVGIISQRDLLRAKESTFASSPAEAHAMERWVKAGWVMTRDIRTTTPSASAAEAARTLRDRGIGCLPVVDRGELVGILTEADLIDHAIQRLEDAGS